MSVTAEARTILITREFEAPRELVFQCFTDPKHLVHWSHAGDGWTTPYAETDPRPGGRFRIGYQSADASEKFDFEGTYDEVNPPSRLAYTIDDGRPVTVDFTDLGGRTRVDLVLTLEDINSEELQRQGWTEHLVNLEAYLRTL
jgi:uncharacterized protein YndB with AHSA1/START domain